MPRPSVQNYPVRTSHRANLTLESIGRIAQEQFGSASSGPEGVLVSYGALARLLVRPAGRELAVEVTMNPKVPEEVARETIARYNRFLEEVTGFSAKERAKRLRKSAGTPSAGA